MAVGVIDKFYKPGDLQKQVLVVVTSGWSVMCFDHNLKKLWENDLKVLNTVVFSCKFHVLKTKRKLR